MGQNVSTNQTNQFCTTSPTKQNANATALSYANASAPTLGSTPGGTIQPGSNFRFNPSPMYTPTLVTPHTETMTLYNLLKEYKSKVAEYNNSKDNLDKKFNTSCMSYTLVAVGTDGTISTTMGLTGSWTKSNPVFKGFFQALDNKSFLSVSMINPVKYLACTTDFQYYGVAASDPTYTQTTHNNLSTIVGGKLLFTKIALAPNQSIIGVGTDHNLYVSANLINNLPHPTVSPSPNATTKAAGTPSSWMGPFQAISGNVKILDFAICPDNSIYGVGTDNQLYSLPSYTELNASWVPFTPAVNNIKSIAIAPDGKLFAVMTSGSGNPTDGFISYLEDWNNPQGTWLPLGSNSCCYQSISAFLMDPINEAGKCTALIQSEKVANLMNETTKIRNYIKNNKDFFSTVGGEIGQAISVNNELAKIYQELQEDRRKINLALRLDQQLDEEGEDQTRYVNAKYMMFRILFAIVLILLMYTIGNVTGNDIMGNSLFTFFIACLLLAAVGLFEGTFGFLLFCLICLAVVLFVSGVFRV